MTNESYVMPEFSTNQLMAELESARERIVELEALIIEADAAFNIDRMPADIESAALALVRMCHEGRAALDELSQRKWTEVTDDRETWPGLEEQVIFCWEEDPGEFMNEIGFGRDAWPVYGEGVFWMLLPEPPQ